MTPQLEMFAPEEMGVGRSLTRLGEAGQLFEVGLPPELAAELEPVKGRILNALQSLNANYIEAGRSLERAQKRLSRDQFLSWVTSDLELSPRTARMIMRAAARADPSIGLLGRRKKLAPHSLKNMVRAATVRRPTPNKAASRATKASKAAPHDWGETSEKEERRQDGTPATLEGNIGNDTDKNKSTAMRLQAQAYAVRWLVRRYGVSAAMAAVIVTELGMGGVS